MTVYQALITIIGMASCWGWGWVARENKYERDKKRELTKVKQKDVYLEDMGNNYDEQG